MPTSLLKPRVWRAAVRCAPLASTLLALAMLLGMPGHAVAQANPFSDHTRWMYAGLKLMLGRSAEKMPAEKYGFRPTEEVRTFGQIIGHLTDTQYRFCSMVLGEEPPVTNAEQSERSKEELVAALQEALTYCDRAYDTMTDEAGAQMIRLHADMPRLGILQVNNLHSTVHYGNLVTYLRMNDIVPPTSEPGFVVEPPQ